MAAARLAFNALERMCPSIISNLNTLLNVRPGQCATDSFNQDQIHGMIVYLSTTD